LRREKLSPKKKIDRSRKEEVESGLLERESREKRRISLN